MRILDKELKKKVLDALQKIKDEMRNKVPDLADVWWVDEEGSMMYVRFVDERVDKIPIYADYVKGRKVIQIGWDRGRGYVGVESKTFEKRLREILKSEISKQAYTAKRYYELRKRAEKKLEEWKEKLGVKNLMLQIWNYYEYSIEYKVRGVRIAIYYDFYDQVTNVVMNVSGYRSVKEGEQIFETIVMLFGAMEVLGDDSR